ncbi:unnamed protein product [Bemisia tabaci]|uniref:Iron-binding zinc finger CDGSH type domain-containing protein n=1 Tax=Bemisia tabaci TaxID=7038 RepID=A0A9P0A795_BEMTA|nr:unnamed protein product [Bemisia tabaci]
MIKFAKKCVLPFHFSKTSKLSTPHSAAIYTSTFGKLGKFNPSDFIPKNVLQPFYTAWKQAGFGRPAEKRPFPIELKADKVYMWCACGWSRHQPFCDGTHKNPLMKITMRPVKFAVEKDGKYWLCRCKATKHRPFCDGSHKCNEIQDKLKYL